MTAPAIHPRFDEAPQPIIRVSDLRQWVYCPRVAWFTLVCPVGKVQSHKMRLGKSREDCLARLQKRRSLHAFSLERGMVRRSVDLFSQNLGLSGRLDLLIECERRAFPVEIKLTAGPTRLNHRIQLAAYALLLADVARAIVPFGYILRLPGESVDRVDFDEPLLETARSLIHAVRDMIRHEATPPASPILARCNDCEYRNFCGDVL